MKNRIAIICIKSIFNFELLHIPIFGQRLSMLQTLVMNKRLITSVLIVCYIRNDKILVSLDY